MQIKTQDLIQQEEDVVNQLILYRRMTFLAWVITAFTAAGFIVVSTLYYVRPAQTDGLRILHNMAEEKLKGHIEMWAQAKAENNPYRMRTAAQSMADDYFDLGDREGFNFWNKTYEELQRRIDAKKRKLKITGD